MAETPRTPKEFMAELLPKLEALKKKQDSDKKLTEKMARCDQNSSVASGPSAYR